MFEKEAEEYSKETYCGEVFHTARNAFKDGAEFGYNKANEWHYVKDKLPPEPESDGKAIKPLCYICAYECGDDYNCGEFMYMGNGEWLGENKRYPIYAWLDCSVNVPKPLDKYH